MKILIGLFFLSVAAQAKLVCEKQGNRFLVTDEGGKRHEQRISGNFLGTVYGCGDLLAGIYDGWDLYVFDNRTKRFAWKETAKDYVAGDVVTKGGLLAFSDGRELTVYQETFTSTPVDNYIYPKIAASADLAAYYDGLELIVFDAASRNFSRWKTRTKASNARVTIFKTTVGFYDGGEVYAYDGAAQRLFTANVRDSITSLLMAGLRSVIFYEGDSLFAYCGGQNGFKSYPIKKGDWSGEHYDEANDRYEMRLGSELVRVDGKSCALQR